MIIQCILNDFLLVICHRKQVKNVFFQLNDIENELHSRGSRKFNFFKQAFMTTHSFAMLILSPLHLTPPPHHIFLNYIFSLEKRNLKKKERKKLYVQLN